MDTIFEKMGIYDLIGIWMPGALTLTYYLFTLMDCFSNLFCYCNIQTNKITDETLFVILYTAIAFMLGMILHEIGKILIDFISKFDVFNIHNTINPNTNTNTNITQPRCFSIFKKIRWNTQKTLELNGINTLENFQKVMQSVKYNKKIDTKRIDKYHSIYGLSRSLWLCFLFHLIILIVFKRNIFLIIVDCVLAFLFHIRTYRYFYSWIKNVYLQYYFSNIQS